MSRTTIRSVTVEPLNIPLLEPFTIATGTTTEARNVLITITLEDGSVGYGESTPFSPSTGETQETALAAARGCAELLKSKDAAHWRILSKLLRGVFFSQMTAIAGIEVALLDALTHSYGIPLYVFFGGSATAVETDISIPLVTPEHAYDLAKAIVARGITTIKIKVGGDIREDVVRVQAVREAAPGIGLMLDANQGYTASEALLCLEALDDHGIRPLLMEQPVHKDDYEGLRYVTQHTPVPVAADESAYSAANVAHLIAMGAINVVNIKLMKSGFVEALDIAAVCRATHTQLMIGAMMESRLATSAAAHFVAGLCGFCSIYPGTSKLLSDDSFFWGGEAKGGGGDGFTIKKREGSERE